MNVHLNKQGRWQAEQTAAWLEEYPVQVIYSSPLSRAVETAEPLASLKGLDINIHTALNEIDYGTFVGKSFEELKNDQNWLKRVKDPATMTFPQGESILEVEQRVRTFYAELQNKHTEDGTIVCYSHADTIRMMVAVALGLPLATYTRIDISPASVSAVSSLQGLYKIHFVNLVPYGKFRIPTIPQD